MRRILCNLFGHIRHRRRARLTLDGWRSPCVFCRAPLIRIAPGDWRVYEKPDAPRSNQLDFLAQLDRFPRPPTASNQ